jgi:hypothetical protein
MPPTMEGKGRAACRSESMRSWVIPPALPFLAPTIDLSTGRRLIVRG